MGRSSAQLLPSWLRTTRYGCVLRPADGTRAIGTVPLQRVFFNMWNTISPMLDTDDVVRVRVAAKCWNDGRRFGKMGNIFFQLLRNDPFAKHWHHDAEGYKLCTLRHPIMEGFRRVGIQEAVFFPSYDLRAPEREDMSRSAEDRIYALFINQRNAECHDLDTISDGSMSPDLGEMWHHGYLVSPQWEGGLELDSASDDDAAYGPMVH